MIRPVAAPSPAAVHASARGHVVLLGCAIRLASTRPGGTNSYGKWPLLDGTTFIDQRFGAAVAYHTPASFSDAFQYAVSGTTVRYIITKPLSIDFI
ncbi:hypothetical protein [Ralstonia pseudosolanacearum]|uniref:hypothetical protein n=1 Tax=Ralstonia pseudosolanacearum TaxID=1310165 RepID=UPI003F7A97AB